MKMLSQLIPRATDHELLLHRGTLHKFLSPRDTSSVNFHQLTGVSLTVISCLAPPLDECKLYDEVIMLVSCLEKVRSSLILIA